MLFGAIAYLLVGIPQGDLQQDELAKLPNKITNETQVRDNLQVLASIIDDSDGLLDAPYAEFWKASRSSTQRIASRRVRFPFYVRAVGSDNII